MNISDMEEEDDPTALKKLGNDAFHTKDFLKAIRLYTLALQNLPESDAPAVLEARRNLLANRGQAYHSFGDIFTALRDINMALSPRYTKPDSPTTPTLKCHFRRAKLLFLFARYDEAKVEFDLFRSLSSASNVPQLETAETELGKEINKGVTAPKSGKQYQKEQLIRAVDARGLIIRLDDHPNFPYPPEELLQGRSADMLDPVLTLVRRRGTQAPSDMRLAPIAYPS
ncbi:hypothetical protein BKA93DRAFT_558464 [Sparassis latifolia]